MSVDCCELSVGKTNNYADKIDGADRFGCRIQSLKLWVQPATNNIRPTLPNGSEDRIYDENDPYHFSSS
jgi:hypothetical protein